MTGPLYRNKNEYTNYLELSYKESKINHVQLITILKEE
jgi:hypothetical protein